ncbi:protein kinase domain-containing protein [Streptomyces millisiae]|uniref:non-specific serine/threonine protein kinase n=1 Tax=Streptomyces millisiae TaxID=3075542 RepID=A0ABU2LNQ6_9ACTN|nr:proprotein convertase P-domain-containing protein [Streptomyces sp. DSM 44918]MDT0319214.1 protein kinase [Streptomyces sp. DSM 44918]
MDRAVGPGKVIGGRYELVEPIGSGGFGRVWKAHDRRLQADVAVKGLSVPPSASPVEQEERLRRSEREALNAARLRDHPHIVSVYDVVVEDDVPWLVMQLVVGRSLSERLRESGPLSADEATDVARAMLHALDAAHRAGIVHRDIKPANVLLADNGGILLTDFGIATHETDVSLTVTGAVIGSVPYMAPERVLGRKSEAPSDLFSLGVTLHEAVEGASPFDRDSTPASLHAVAYEEPPPPRRAGPLTPLITRLLAKAPEDRPTVAEALALLDSPPAETESRREAAPPTAVVTEKAPLPPEALPTATALAPPRAVSTPPVAHPLSPYAPPVGGAGVPPTGGGSGARWLGWFLAVALAVALGTLVIVQVVGDREEDRGSETTSWGPGEFGNASSRTIEDLGSVESTIEVAGVTGNAPGTLGVTVDISHTYINDLDIQLVSPDGTTFELDPYDGSHEYTLDASAATASGTWTLRVEDTLSSDSGTLNSWSLDFGSQQGEQPTSSGGGTFDNTTSMTIEDLGSVESTIEVAGVTGNAPGTLGVTIDISHTYINDLDIQLVSPDGTTFELDPYDEPHEYTLDASAATASGTWTLRVEDTLSSDSGTLNSWSLRF